jgi:hypothetical protein
MRKYVTCVSDEIALKFNAFCKENNQTPYDVLSLTIHKIAGVPRKPRKKARLSEFQKQMTAPDESLDTVQNINRRLGRCCSNDCIGLERDRPKCIITGQKNPRHAND